MQRFNRWDVRTYSGPQRLLVAILGGIVFWIGVPFFVFTVSSWLDGWAGLKRFTYGSVNVFLALLFMIPGWLLANWSVKVQYSSGKGTPIPLMATKKLVTEGPYRYCRNPMALGTSLFYAGIPIWLGSVSAVPLAMIYPAGIMVYNRFVEEKELEARFGSEYLEYKERTPFLIPKIFRR